jgi:hypothetical protein
MNYILAFLASIILIIEISFIPQLGIHLEGLPLGLIISIIIMQKYDVNKGVIFFLGIILIQAFSTVITLDKILINLTLIISLPILIKLVFARRSLVAFNTLFFIVFAFIFLLQLLGLNYDITLITLIISLIIANTVYLNLTYFIVKI